MSAMHERLKAMREQAGLRQGQIAEFLGVTQTFISKVESGEKKLTADALERLLTLYGYSLEAFHDVDGAAHPIQFAYRAQEVNQEDLHAIADIGRIAMNARFMSRLLEGVHD